MAFAHGLALAVMVSALGAVSGGHFNPAVTFGVWLTGRIEPARAALYVVAQLVGGVAAALAVRVGLPRIGLGARGDSARRLSQTGSASRGRSLSRRS